jgi:hypothetical protein
LLLALLLFAGFCGALIWISLWLRPVRGTCVMIVYAGYEDGLAVPHNVYGRRGGDALAQLAENGSKLSQPFKPRQLDDPGTWAQDLSKVRERNLLLYFAVHGGADAQGAYLLTQRAGDPELVGQPDVARNHLRLEAVLERLKEALPASRNIVLLLDCTQVETDIPLGIVTNNFAAELARLEPRIIDIPNLVVLCSSDSEQRSWASEDLGTTVFAHYLVEGLQGAADGAVAEDGRDGQVSAYELHKYTSDHVAQWARRNRGAEQTPVLWPRKDHIGEQRARRIQLTPVPEGYKPTAAPEMPAVFNPPTALMQAWEQRQLLLEQVPAPSIYAPQLWRAYNDTLLRWESLLVAGETRASAKLAGRLRDQVDALQAAQRLDLNSTGITTAMPALAGRWGQVDRESSDALNRLWDAAPDAVATTWANLQKKAGSTSASELLRIKLCGLALERCAENSTANLERTNALLHLLDNPLVPRPAEAHFLVMLHRDLLRSAPGSPAVLVPDRLLKTGIEVRLHAERAAVGLQEPEILPLTGPYAYSEQLMPWIQQQVTDADKLRRQGEDLLFASDTISWDSSKELLSQADKLYKAAQADAARLQFALSIRDRVLAELPYFGTWAAAQALETDEAKLEVDGTLRQQILKLWPDVHLLVDQLDLKGLDKVSVQDRAGKRKMVLESVSEQAFRVKRKFDALREGFEQRCQQLVQAPGADAGLTSVARWQAIDHALLVPSIKPLDRDRLLRQRSALSRNLFTAASTAVEPAVKGQLERVKAAAAWQAQLTLAGWGRRLTEDAGEERHESYDQLMHRLENLAVDQDWRKSADIAGVELAWRWRLLPKEINKYLTAKGDRAANLRAVDRLLRLADGTQSALIDSKAGRVCRNRLVQDLLLWQAERTLAERWAAEDIGADPYFRTAGLALVKDVEALRDPHEGTAEIKKKLQEDFKLDMTLLKAPGLEPGKASPTLLHWTSEDEFPLQYRLAASGTTAAGYPVLWVEPGDKLTVADLTAGQRVVRPLAGLSELPLSIVLRTDVIRAAEAKPPSLPTPLDTRVIIHGLYRGHLLQTQTRIQVHPTAETVESSYPLPTTASVAVRAPREMHAELGSSKGAVAIILDCTGSMGPPRGKTIEQSKYYEAIEALREILKKVPRGTKLSIWIFGQAGPGEKTVSNPADTIEQLQAPITWNPADRDKIEEIVGRARAYEPWNLSPILRAMYTAARRDLAGADGFKTMIVITDGMDNVFAKDTQLNGGNPDPADFIQKNFDDIEIHVVGFRLPRAEEKQVRQQFAAIDKLKYPGTFHTADESREVMLRLQKVFPQKLRYNLATPDNRPLGLTVGGLEASLDGRSDQWVVAGLKPGGYNVQLGGAKSLTQTVALNRGDLLLLELGTDKDGKQALQRVAYSASDVPSAVAQERDGWRFAVLQNQRLNDRGLEMLACLEKLDGNGSERALQFNRPDKVWIEVTPPPETTANYLTRWHYEPGYPAPAWGLDIPTWPARGGMSKALAKPTVKVWWSPDPWLPTPTLIEREPRTQGIKALNNRATRVNEDDVVLESVSIEEHLVEIKPGTAGEMGTRQLLPCLVVRVSHPRGSPVWVQPAGLDVAGEEHRYYNSAGKYTAIFWLVTKDQAEKNLTGVELYSLRAFKSEAEKRKCAMELKNLYEPLATDVRPTEPLRLQSSPGPVEEGPLPKKLEK